MASILKVDEMQGVTSAGDITITGEGGSATQSLQQGVVKCWADINGNSTAHIDDSFNAASLNDLGTGRYKVTYTNSMSSSEYFSFDSNSSETSGTYGQATTSANAFANNASGTAQDVGYIGLGILGDLA